MAKKLTFYILMGMMLGIVVGAGLHFAYTGSVLTAPAEIAADAKTALVRSGDARRGRRAREGDPPP